MAIQISEKHLSPEAKRALSNAKNKSQFMRDAIEFYVRRGFDKENIEVSCDSEIRKDIKEVKQEIKELKEILKNLNTVTVNETAASIENIVNDLNDTKLDEDKEENKSEVKGDIEKKDDLDNVEIPDCYL